MSRAYGASGSLIRNIEEMAAVSPVTALRYLEAVRVAAEQALQSPEASA